MRGAPPVRVAFEPDGRWRAVEAALVGAAVASAVGWVGWHLGADPGLAGPAIAAAAASAAAGMWRRTPLTRELAWTGEAWLLDGRPGRPRATLDVGDGLLLCFTFDEGRRAAWLAPDLRRLEAQRHLLRVALQAQPGTARTQPQPSADG